MRFEFERTFGVEIELLARYSGETLISMLNDKLADQDMHFRSASWSDRSNSWRIKSDSSLRGTGEYEGYEIVTPVLEGQTGFNQLHKLLLTIQDINQNASRLGEAPVFRINRSCGLHVHWGVSDWRIKHFRNLYKRYLKFETAIDSIMAPSRRRNNNEYCGSLLSRLNNYVEHGDEGNPEVIFKRIDQSRTASQIRNLFNTRYMKLNIESFWNHGTIEFRHHSGTFDVTKVIAWVFLTGAMVRAADVQRGIRSGVDNLNQMNSKFMMMFNGLCKVHEDLAVFKTFYKDRIKSLREINRRES